MSASRPDPPDGAGTGPGAALRVAVVGASRRRQGLGPFVVRDLLEGGARVSCFLATRPSTRDATLRELCGRHRIACRGYLDFEEMLREEEIDALAILSPSETHAEYLLRALDAGLHTLCEKPLLWDGHDLATRAEDLLAGFERAGLVLHENCQWPYTLPAFSRLHPGVLDEPFRSFEMEMQPVTPGVGRLGDSLPHALSLVQTLAPGPARLEDLAFRETGNGDDGRLDVTFAYRSANASPLVRVSLQRSDAVPRRVAYAVNGRRALRTVDDEYQLRFAHGDRSVPVEDPLTLLVADFIAEVAGRPRRSRRDEILRRVALLEEITRGYLGWEGARAS